MTDRTLRQLAAIALGLMFIVVALTGMATSSIPAAPPTTCAMLDADFPVDVDVDTYFIRVGSERPILWMTTILNYQRFGIIAEIEWSVDCVERSVE